MGKRVTEVIHSRLSDMGGSLYSYQRSVWAWVWGVPIGSGNQRERGPPPAQTSELPSLPASLVTSQDDALACRAVDREKAVERAKGSPLGQWQGQETRHAGLINGACFLSKQDDKHTPYEVHH